MAAQNWWSGMVSALSSFVRPAADPTQVAGGNAGAQRPDYGYLLSYYNNSIYEDAAKWAIYRGNYKLYREVRALYNPCRRIVDLYSSLVYPGFLSEDGSTLPDGVALAIPLSADTPKKLKRAISTFWKWSNFQAGKSIIVRYGGIAGNVLVEVVDDPERQKVTANIVWPDLVADDIEIDASGNVKSYALQYDAYEGTTPFDRRGRITTVSPQSYTYRKTVDSEWIRTFKNDKPFDYDGGGAERRNPYSFVPAVWYTFRDFGGTYGLPALHGVFGKVDEINSIFSHLSDHAHKKIASPMFIASDGSIINLLAKQKKRAGSSDDEFSATDLSPSEREGLFLLQGPTGASVHSMAGDISISDMLADVKELIAEVEADLPELVMFQEMRAMSQVTGPGAARMMGDVVGAVTEVMANYDVQTIKLSQMVTAIAGMRANDGSWTHPLTAQQQAFAGYDLDSYAAGDLDFAIDPRPIVPMTTSEQLAIEQQRQNLAAPPSVTEAAKTSTA